MKSVFRFASFCFNQGEEKYFARCGAEVIFEAIREGGSESNFYMFWLVFVRDKIYSG
jgi:hypothetical protein